MTRRRLSQTLRCPPRLGVDICRLGVGFFLIRRVGGDFMNSQLFPTSSNLFYYEKLIFRVFPNPNSATYLQTANKNPPSKTNCAPKTKAHKKPTIDCALQFQNLPLRILLSKLFLCKHQVIYDTAWLWAQSSYNFS